MKKEATVILDQEEVFLLDDDDESEFFAPALKKPTVAPKKIDLANDKAVKEPEGIEVISVVWPEEKHGKQYLYDPHGETLEEGDVVLVPSYDKERDIDITREATVAIGNHRVDLKTVRRTPKKILEIVSRKADAIPPEQEEEQAESTPAETPEAVTESQKGFSRFFRWFIGK